MTDSRSDDFTVRVVRSGGFAGLRREWRIRSSEAPDVDWAALVDACPWNEPEPYADARARDRFSWRVEVTGPATSRPRSATLGDARLTGSWRSLVDAVREHAGD